MGADRALGSSSEGGRRARRRTELSTAVMRGITDRISEAGNIILGPRTLRQQILDEISKCDSCARTVMRFALSRRAGWRPRGCTARRHYRTRHPRCRVGNLRRCALAGCATRERVHYSRQVVSYCAYCRRSTTALYRDREGGALSANASACGPSGVDGPPKRCACADCAAYFPRGHDWDHFPGYKKSDVSRSRGSLGVDRLAQLKNANSSAQLPRLAPSGELGSRIR